MLWLSSACLVILAASVSSVSEAVPQDTPRRDNRCNGGVPLIYMPVCGSDGKVYNNKYELRLKNACQGTNIEIVEDKSECRNFPTNEGLAVLRRKRSPLCLVPVPDIWDPVCGSDGKMYDNKYALEAKNQCEGTSVRIADRSQCPESE